MTPVISSEHIKAVLGFEKLKDIDVDTKPDDILQRTHTPCKWVDNERQCRENVSLLVCLKAARQPGDLVWALLMG